MNKKREFSVLLMTFLIITNIVFSTFNIAVLPGAYCADNKMRVLTSNDYDDENPQTHNGYVVWQGSGGPDGGSDYEIFLYDGSSTTQLTRNDYDDINPQIHNGQVTWQGYDGNDYEIFLNDGSREKQLTNNEETDEYPQIHNGNVTWQGYDGSDLEIFLYEGHLPNIQVTNNLYEDEYPQIHNGIVTWQYWDGNDYEIGTYTGTGGGANTGNQKNDRDPQIHNGWVTWQGYDDFHDVYGILMINATVGGMIIPLTPNDEYSEAPQIHNGQVSWLYYFDGVPETVLYDGSSTIQLSYDGYPDAVPQIHNGQVTWQSDDGSDKEIFLYNGSATTQLTDDWDDDLAPQIHHGWVTWQGHEGGADFEIYLYDARTPWEVLVDRVTAAEDLITTIQDKINSIQDKITNIMSTLSGIATSLNNILSDLGAAQDRIDSLEAENAALRSDFDALNARMSETEIKFIELPGVRLNIYLPQSEYTISADETSHVWHGFKSNLWSEYNETEKTEFLSTAQWRFSVNGEEVLLDHVLRLKGDYMWSIFYRVFPPGYFKIGNHGLVGEWHSMEGGVWDSDVREAKLKVK